MLVARSASQLQEAAATIRHEPDIRVETFTADVSLTGSADAIVQETIARFGKLDILANNAGSNIRKPFLDVTEDDFEAVTSIQLKAAYFLAQAAAKEMVKNSGGKIINLATLTSKIGVPNKSVYGAAKGGIFALTKSMALELAPHGINVNAVAPGYVRTSMSEAAFLDKERCDWMLSRIPMKRFGTPEDIGNADPYGITLAVSTFTAVDYVGMPEARIILAQCATYLASAPKSNAAYKAIRPPSP